MEQGTLFKKPAATETNIERLTYSENDKQGTVDVDLVALLDAGKIQSIPYALWKDGTNIEVGNEFSPLGFRFDNAVVKVGAVSPILNKRNDFLRSVAIYICFGNHDLLVLSDEDAEEWEDVWEKIDDELAEMNVTTIHSLWGQVRRGVGFWEKYLGEGHTF